MQLLNNIKQTLKLITKNSRTVGGPLPPVPPPLRHLAQQPPHRYATEYVYEFLSKTLPD